MAEIPNIKPNSNRYREQSQVPAEPEHRVSKVTKGVVKKSQETGFKKFAKSFIPEDAKSIKDYVLEESPGLIQSFLRRLFQNILDTYLPDNGRYFSSGRGGSRGTNTSFRYDNVIRAGGSLGGAAVKSRNVNTVYEYENVTFEDYADADFVLTCLYECLSKYEKVRVFDLYDLAGVKTNSTDRDYGWVDLNGTKIVPTKEGWVIDLPRAISLI